MDIENVARIAFAILFSWTGLGCFLGAVRFKYPPLLILGVGYISWVVAFIIWPSAKADLATRNWTLFIVCSALFVLGAGCIFGYRFTFYPRMKAAGITPRRLFGFGSR